MKIDSTSSLNRMSRQEGQVSNASRPAATENVKSSESVSTRWVPSSAQDSSQDINTARVDELRDAIREGRFEVNTGKIADGLIESAQELLSNKG